VIVIETVAFIGSLFAGSTAVAGGASAAAGAAGTVGAINAGAGVTAALNAAAAPSAFSLLGVAGEFFTGLQILSGISTANENTEILEREAKLEEFKARTRADQLRAKGRRIQSKGLNIAAASGIDPFSGTALEISLQSAENAVANEENARISGRFAAGAKREAASFSRGLIPGIVISGIGDLIGRPRGQSLFESMIRRRNFSIR